MKLSRTVRGRAAVLLGLLLSIALWKDAYAIRERRVVQESATITNPEGESRLLFSFGSFQGFRDEMVISARLLISTSSPLETPNLSLAIGTPDIPWQESLEWNRLWEGQDSDTLSNSDVITVNSDDGRIGSNLDLDVTELVRKMAQGELLENGFFLAPADLSRDGFTEQEMEAFSLLAESELVIRYRKISALSISDGGRERMARLKLTGREGE